MIPYHQYFRLKMGGCAMFMEGRGSGSKPLLIFWFRFENLRRKNQILTMYSEKRILIIDCEKKIKFGNIAMKRKKGWTSGFVWCKFPNKLFSIGENYNQEIDNIKPGPVRENDETERIGSESNLVLLTLHTYASPPVGNQTFVKIAKFHSFFFFL